MAPVGANTADSPIRLLAVFHGLWGERIAENISHNRPPGWQVFTWQAPKVIPPVVDDPQDYLNSPFPEVDLLLALAETPGLAQLIPEMALQSHAQAVIAPIDRNESLPAGLARQVAAWLGERNIAVIFPKPFCSLDENGHNRVPIRAGYSDERIRAFARHFGRPRLEVQVAGGVVSGVNVVRDSACGCARYVAEGLVGCQVENAVEEAGMLHHHYPCLASMNIDPDYRDTLMHVSGHFLRDEVQAALAQIVPTAYLRPSNLVD